MTEISVQQAPARSQAHEEYLTGQAILPSVLDTAGVFSDGDVIVFPWQDGDQLTCQRRMWPDPPSLNGGPKSAKYLWEAGKSLHLWAIRPVTADTRTVLVIEGTKQSLAVASWASPDYAVYGMAGCDGWVNADLSRFAGLRVIIMLDADAGSNYEVYEAGEALGGKLDLLGAEPRFVTSPGRAKDGIDDFLAGIADGQRAGVLANLLAKADGKNADKPAARKPAKKASKPDDGDRPGIMVNRDRFDVICDITNIMLAKFSGTSLFNFGGVIAELKGTDTIPLDRNLFARWLALAVSTYKLTDKGCEHTWPDYQTMGAILAGADIFAPLDRVSRTPFIRNDGTACTMPGYDAASRTWLMPGPDGGPWPDVPGDPSPAAAADAARVLLEDWLGDMPFRDEASRANALALVLTPFIRGLVPLVPLAVISGLQMGVGKGLLTDCIALLITGDIDPPLPWQPDDDDENRKLILSVFSAGTNLFRFDEAHEIGGTALARALTALTYADRILGVTKIARYPNRATWMSNGNQVQVLGDMSRRAYFIELYPGGPNPQDRPESDFAHPRLREWTAAHRAGLASAALAVIRSWYAAGCPAYSRSSAMGSFEAWDAMMSGILAHAGVPGFLGNLTAKRAERDTTGNYWADHLAWLHATFSDREFTLAEVKAAAVASGGTWEAPPRLEDTRPDGYTRTLGQAYAKVQDRWFPAGPGSVRVAKAGRGHGNVGKWVIQVLGTETVPDLDRGQRGEQDSEQPTVADPGVTGVVDESPSPIHARTHAPARAPAYVKGGGVSPVTPINQSLSGSDFALGFDLETDSAGRLFTRPRGSLAADGTGYVRLAGITGPPGRPSLVPPAQLPAMLAGASAWYGHNICGFDGLALAWHQAEDPRAFWDWFCDRARDTELIARQAYPPRSRESGSSEDKLGLDAVAALCGIPGKTDSLPRLAKLHGGYDAIPPDDPEYVSYLLDGDMPATHGVWGALGHYYDSDPYLPREHRLARIAGHMRLNGLLVDQDLLRERYEAGEKRKRTACQFLHGVWGLPLGRNVMRGRGKAKADVFEEFTSPLSTDEGRAWLQGQWDRYGITDPPRTKTGKLALGAAELKVITDDPACPADLRAMITAMNVVTTTRTVYQTALNWLCPDGRVHPGISFRQASGRWSVTDPGMTVFGKRDGRHVERDIFVAGPGCSLWSFDLEQVDMRAIAWLSQDPAYMALFEPGRDAHSEIAARVFGEMPRDEKGRHPWRQKAKVPGHGWNYGMGPKRMIEDPKIAVTPDIAYAFDNGMKDQFPVLCGWRDSIRERAQAGEILDNGFGRRMRAEPSRGYTVGPALMGQGGARDILGMAMLRLDPGLYRYLLLQVHDELVFELPDDIAGEAVPAIKAAMTFGLEGPAGMMPILVDASGPGRSFGEISAK